MNNLAEQIYQSSLDLPDEAAFEVLDFIAMLKMRLVHNQSASRPVAVTGEDSPLFRQLQEIGFIGCRTTDEQLASTYKQRLDFSVKAGNKP